MFKWLFVFAGVYLFCLYIKGKRQLKAGKKNNLKPKHNEVRASIEPEDMVPCHYCKMYLPKSEALMQEERFYCSKEHLHALDKQGWFGSALWRNSSNFDTRPEQVKPDLVVIHHISLPPGQFKLQGSSQHIVDFFQNRLDPKAHPYFAQIACQKVCSHFLITRSGTLIQFVSTQNRAWHAGVSSFMGRENCNDFSIGIELEGDADSAFEGCQYQMLAFLVQKFQVSYPSLQFAGHSDIAPGRKTDPGVFFDWERFHKEAGIPAQKMPYGLNAR